MQKRLSKQKTYTARCFTKCLMVFSFPNSFSSLYLMVLASIWRRMPRARKKPRQVKADHFVGFLFHGCMLKMHSSHMKRKGTESPNLPTGYFLKVSQLVG